MSDARKTTAAPTRRSGPARSRAAPFHASMKAGSSDRSTGRSHGAYTLHAHLKAGDLRLVAKDASDDAENRSPERLAAPTADFELQTSRLQTTRHLESRTGTIVTPNIVPGGLMRSKWMTVGVLAVVFSAGAAASAVLPAAGRAVAARAAVRKRAGPRVEVDHPAESTVDAAPPRARPDHRRAQGRHRSTSSTRRARPGRRWRGRRGRRAGWVSTRPASSTPT